MDRVRAQGGYGCFVDAGFLSITSGPYQAGLPGGVARPQEPPVGGVEGSGMGTSHGVKPKKYAKVSIKSDGAGIGVRVLSHHHGTPSRACRMALATRSSVVSRWLR